MTVHTAENIETNIKQALKNAIVDHEPQLVQTDMGEAIIISKEDYRPLYGYNEETARAIQEALNEDDSSTPGYTDTESLLEALYSEED